jgi:hypothetical protein
MRWGSRVMFQSDAVWLDCKRMDSDVTIGQRGSLTTLP